MSSITLKNDSKTITRKKSNSLLLISLSPESQLQDPDAAFTSSSEALTSQQKMLNVWSNNHKHIFIYEIITTWST